ncbi:uncharacterized protein LOC131674101 [Phymastichus coffea]|uniref:uncharacterized protein LOC131674101 n=1 Tax=Phymastichus coffea TaxID=108790 RepID=UPI00273C831C|nr:uncharacterized protein LOC131674101 [Phymastichus coffea]
MDGSGDRDTARYTETPEPPDPMDIDKNLKRTRDDNYEESVEQLTNAKKHNRQEGIPPQRKNAEHGKPADKDSTTHARPENPGYSNAHKGPFHVWVKYSLSTDKPFDIYKIGKIVANKYRTVIEVKRDGRSKGLIIFRDREEASRSLNDTAFNDNGLSTFIPGFKKIRKGVLKGIPVDYDTKELHGAIECESKVIEVTRLNTRNRQATNDDDKWLPTTSVLVSFETGSLPAEVKIYNVITKVTPYVRKVMQCLNCFKFGHYANKCRGKKRCSMCGETDHPNEACQGLFPRCANYKESHKSNNRDCKIFKMHAFVNEKMAFENISYYEAKQLVFGSPTGPLNTKESFPGLARKVNAKKSFASTARITKPLPEENPSTMGNSASSAEGTTNSKCRSVVSGTETQSQYSQSSQDIEHQEPLHLKQTSHQSQQQQQQQQEDTKVQQQQSQKTNITQPQLQSRENQPQEPSMTDKLIHRFEIPRNSKDYVKTYGKNSVNPTTNKTQIPKKNGKK